MSKLLREFISSETSSILSEDYARGIPDFALSQVASESAEGLKRHLRRHITQVTQDPVRQRQMFAAANEVLADLEIEIKEVLEDKLLKFQRNV